MKKKDKNAIDEILAEFDFDKVHKVMKYLKWEWYDIGIPSAEQIRRKAEELLIRTCTEKLLHCSTGGLMAHRYKKGVFRLAFSIEDWDTFE